MTGPTSYFDPARVRRARSSAARSSCAGAPPPSARPTVSSTAVRWSWSVVKAPGCTPGTDRRLPGRVQQRGRHRARAPGRHPGRRAAAGGLDAGPLAVPARRLSSGSPSGILATMPPEGTGHVLVHDVRHRGERPRAADRESWSPAARGCDRDIATRITASPTEIAAISPSLAGGHADSARAPGCARSSRDPIDPAATSRRRSTAAIGELERRRHPAGRAHRRHDLRRATGCCPSSPGLVDAGGRAMRAAGGLFIADEVQPGFGRTGRRDVGIRPLRAHGPRRPTSSPSASRWATASRSPP